MIDFYIFISVNNVEYSEKYYSNYSFSGIHFKYNISYQISHRIYKNKIESYVIKNHQELFYFSYYND